MKIELTAEQKNKTFMYLLQLENSTLRLPTPLNLPAKPKKTERPLANVACQKSAP